METALAFHFRRCNGYKSFKPSFSIASTMSSRFSPSEVQPAEVQCREFLRPEMEQSYEPSELQCLDLPPDPLLDPGSFIEVTEKKGETVVGAEKRDRYEKAAMLSESFRPCLGPEIWTAEQQATPPELPQNTEPEFEPIESGGSGTRRIEAGARGSSSRTTDWLPPGWEVESRIRTSGATAGMTDKYYYDPVSRRRFRSRKEVLHFLETGTVRKRQKSTNNSNSKSGSAANFDFCNVPEEVEWVNSGSSDGSWTPFTGGERVPESIRLHWAAAYVFVTCGNASILIV